MNTILIIDDDDYAVLPLEKIIQDMGHRFIHAKSGKEGFELARSQLPDLIFLDIRMPNFDGFDVIEKLNWEGKAGEAPIVMFTASSAPEDIIKAMKAGATDYITKPVDLDVLKRKTEALLDLVDHQRWEREANELSRVRVSRGMGRSLISFSELVPETVEEAKIAFNPVFFKLIMGDKCILDLKAPPIDTPRKVKLINEIIALFKGREFFIVAGLNFPALKDSGIKIERMFLSRGDVEAELNRS